MIIGISGRINSGKDTVGEIICNTDGCFAARDDMGAGKKWYWNENAKHWQIKKFAGKLKTIASLLTGIPVEKFEDQEFKKTYLGSEWNILSNYKSTEDFVSHDVKELTVREFLQKLGTEAIRDGIHTNAWVNALFADYKLQPHSGITRDLKYPNWIITDTRFPNEAQAIKDRGGIVIRVNRASELPSEYKTLEEYIKTLHPSETSLDNWKFDYVIENDSTIKDLKLKVTQILKELQL